MKINAIFKRFLLINKDFTDKIISFNGLIQGNRTIITK